MRTRTALSATAAAVCVLTLFTGCGGASDAPGAGSGDADEPTSSGPTGDKATQEPAESESGPESSAPAEKAVVITIEEFMYSKVAPVAPGTEVTIENTDAEVHTVTAEGQDGFDITIAPGRSKTLIAPEKAGDYPYLCSFHSGMTATLVVK